MTWKHLGMVFLWGTRKIRFDLANEWPKIVSKVMKVTTGRINMTDFNVQTFLTLDRSKYQTCKACTISMICSIVSIYIYIYVCIHLLGHCFEPALLSTNAAKPSPLWLWWNIPGLCGHTPTIVKSMSSDTDKTICKRCCSDFLTSHPSIPISGLHRFTSYPHRNFNGVPYPGYQIIQFFIQFSQVFPWNKPPNNN